ncbi:Mth938-like domain-containing protein [Azohydromonas sediminis]|uniref:Mth938-like domain-containing protein n=1 Tax=Azohydromonas sediminis TaxID=2259674 RepID=UPI000E658FBB|nr:Mth938-like domain-containing protein [Azohydromonas sediminis]
MKFQPDRLDGVNVISRHDAGRVWINATEWRSSVLVPWRGDAVAWPVQRLADLTAAHFEQLIALQPEVVIFGSGTRLRFVAPALQRALIERRIGVETMDTGAACRTYNVLASEGRMVAAALLIEPGG